MRANQRVRPQAEQYLKNHLGLQPTQSLTYLVLDSVDIVKYEKLAVAQYPT